MALAAPAESSAQARPERRNPISATLGRAGLGTEVDPTDFPWLARFDAKVSRGALTGTDDAAAINACMAWVATLPAGGVVKLPSRLARTSSTLVVPNKVDLVGTKRGWTSADGSAWDSGSGIFRDHGGDAIAVTANNNGTLIDQVSVWSDARKYPQGRGIVVGPAFGCRVQRCGVFTCGQDSFVLGDNTINSYMNYGFDLYSNNPGARSFVIGSRWFVGDILVCDGGVIGIDVLDNSQDFQIGHYHCEGWKAAGIQSAGGRGKFTGLGVLLPYVSSRTVKLSLTQASVTAHCADTSHLLIGQAVVGPGVPGKTFIQAFIPGVGFRMTNAASSTHASALVVIGLVGINQLNVSGSQSVDFGQFTLRWPAMDPSSQGVRWSGPHNVDNRISAQTTIAFAGTGVFDGGAYNTISGTTFYGCNIDISASGDYYTYINNKTTLTQSAYSIEHNTGMHGVWRGNFLDKPPHALLTGRPGDFGGVVIADMPTP